MGEAILTRRGGGTDASDATATAENILSSKTAYIDDSGDPVAGTMVNNGAVSNGLAINGTYTIPAGYHNGSGKVTQSITTKSAATYTPSTSTQTIAAGQYLSGAQTISGDTNLVTANIKSGTTIFGIAGKSSVVETSDATATAANILASSTVYVNGSKLTGTMANNGAVSNSLAVNGTYTIPAGYHNGSGKVTQSITTKSAATITPGTSNQTIAAGQYLSGAQTIAGSANLIASNIKSGVNIFGVVGTLTGAAPAMSVARYSMAAGSNSNYAMFGGGATQSPGVYHGVVDAYNTSLTRSTATSLSVAKSELSATNIGDHVLFTGGSYYDSWNARTVYNGTVDAYSNTLVRTNPTSLYERRGIASTSNGTYAIFAYGYNGSSYLSALDSYNSSLVKMNTQSLSARTDAKAVSIGGYTFIVGGRTGASTYSTTAEYFNNNLVRTSIISLPQPRSGIASGSTNSYALFAGGWTSNGAVSVVDAFNVSGTRTTAASLNSAQDGSSAGASKNGTCLITGGTGVNFAEVASYNDSLVRKMISSLSPPRVQTTGAAIGNALLFAGGEWGTYSAVSTYSV